MASFFRQIEAIFGIHNSIHKNPKKRNTETKKNISCDFGLNLQARVFLNHYYHRNITSTLLLEVYFALWQCEALLESIVHAKNNTLFYRSKLENPHCPHYPHYINKIHAIKSNLAKIEDFQENNENIKSTKASIQTLFHTILNSLPLTTPRELAQNSEAFLAISQDDVEGIVSIETSGTSGALRKRIYCSSLDLQSTEDFFYYGMENVFLDPFKPHPSRKAHKAHKDKASFQDQRVAMLMSGERVGSVGNLMQRAMQNKGVTCKILGFSQDYEKLTQALLEYEPTTIIAIPWHIFSLSQYAKDTNLKKFVRSVLLSGDTCNDIMKAQIANNLDCQVFRHFGMTEFGLGGAVECQEQKAMHVRGLDTYVEILKKNPTALYGEIIITSLTREAAPLLRYATGDFGRIVPSCTCGSIMQQLEIIGRKDQGLGLEKFGFAHLHDFQKFFCRTPYLQDFDIEVHSIAKKPTNKNDTQENNPKENNPKENNTEEKTHLLSFLIFVLHWTIEEETEINKQKSNLAQQISSAFFLQYLEKISILFTDNKEALQDIPLHKMTGISLQDFEKTSQKIRDIHQKGLPDYRDKNVVLSASNRQGLTSFAFRDQTTNHIDKEKEEEKKQDERKILQNCSNNLECTLLTSNKKKFKNPTFPKKNITFITHLL